MFWWLCVCGRGEGGGGGLSILWNTTDSSTIWYKQNRNLYKREFAEAGGGSKVTAVYSSDYIITGGCSKGPAG